MWRSIQVNEQNIQAETDKAVLIACPHNSEYDGFVFWHSAKLVRRGKHANTITLSYTDEHTFCLKKYGKGKYNKRDIIDEVRLGYEDIEEVFGCMNNYVNPYETHKPDEIKAETVTADESLIDNE